MSNTVVQSTKNAATSTTTQNVVVGAGAMGGVLLAVFAIGRSLWPNVWWGPERDAEAMAVALPVLSALASRAVAYWRQPEKFQ